MASVEESSWIQTLETLYPNMLSATYCVPPIYLCRISYRVQQPVTGVNVLVPQPAQGEALAPSKPSAEDLQAVGRRPPQSVWEMHRSDKVSEVGRSQTREDFSQQHVLINLQALSRRLGGEGGDPMFIISQLDFEHYLDKTHSKIKEMFPTPENLPKEYQRGDFDIIIIHLHCGILIGELKAVGLRPGTADAAIANRIRRAAEQLKRATVVMKHLVKDIDEELRVRTTLILPYVSRQKLREILDHDQQNPSGSESRDKKTGEKLPPLAQVLCESVGAADVTEALDLCLCEDDMSNRDKFSQVSDVVLDGLVGWWGKLMSRDPHMNSGVYKKLAARLIGPATTVKVHCVTSPRLEVKTLGQTVAEVGRRFSLLVLTEGQLELLKRAPRLVCLTGPPGTGKTIVLVMKGLIEAQHSECVVVVLQTTPFSHAISKLMHEQLTTTLAEEEKAGGKEVKMEEGGGKDEEGTSRESRAARVRFEECDLVHKADDASIDEAVSRLEKISAGRLCVLMDEANFIDGASPPGSPTRRLVANLTERLGDRLSLWAACVRSSTDMPAVLKEEKLTVPLRSAPRVLQEIQARISGLQGVEPYTPMKDVPPHTEGLGVIYIKHLREEEGGHEGEWPIECFKCGKELASLLTDTLNVGSKGPDTDSAGIVSSSSSKVSKTGPNPQYRDVFVLTRSMHLHETHKDDKGQTKPPSGLVLGLKEGGLPVGVLGWRGDDPERWQKELDDLALAKLTRQVTVARWKAVVGLERKIVAYAPGRDPSVDKSQSWREVLDDDYLYLVSRCSTQLIMFTVPEPDSDT